MDYLNKDICKSIPLFNIDYNKKQNLICGFFKLKKDYKKNNLYIDSLINTYKFIIENYKNYKFKLINYV